MLFFFLLQSKHSGNKSESQYSSRIKAENLTLWLECTFEM